MIRISGGKFHGRVIQSPKDKAVRPTTGMVRESLFSMIQQHLPECRFLDLFSGSGLMGIEALSRNATFVLAVEKNKTHLRLIQENYDKLGISVEHAKAIPLDVFTLLAKKNKEEAFDIIFADPPYGLPNIEEMIALIRGNGWLSESGLIIIENSSRESCPDGFSMKPYGDTALFFWGL